MTLFIITVLLVIFIVLSIFLAWFSLAPWVPTNKKDLERVNKISNLKSGQTFLEMGCGNGRICTYIAKNNPEAEVIGIELSYLFYFFAKIREIFFGPDNLKIIFGNVLNYDVSNIDVLYIFALPESMNKQIKQKISKEMKQDARLVSYIFSIKEWQGETIKHKETPKFSTIYVYKK